MQYGFQDRFEPPILAKTKTQTIRASRTGKTPHVRVGELMHLYGGDRFGRPNRPPRHLIGHALCTRRGRVHLDFTGRRVVQELLEGGALVRIDEPEGLNAFAVADGFSDFDAMSLFWGQTHKATTFEGQLMCWDARFWPSFDVPGYDALRAKDLKAGLPICRTCGCTEHTPCMTDEGPCGWAAGDLCTACAHV